MIRLAYFSESYGDSRAGKGKRHLDIGLETVDCMSVSCPCCLYLFESTTSKVLNDPETAVVTARSAFEAQLLRSVLTSFYEPPVPSKFV